MQKQIHPLVNRFRDVFRRELLSRPREKVSKLNWFTERRNPQPVARSSLIPFFLCLHAPRCSKRVALGEVESRKVIPARVGRPADHPAANHRSETLGGWNAVVGGGRGGRRNGGSAVGYSARRDLRDRG